MKLIGYVGHHVSMLLESQPFRYWSVEKNVEDDLDERITTYVFDGHGLELLCDRADNVKAIFLHSKEYGGFDEQGFELSFKLGRRQVLEHLGTPSKSGKEISDPVLGKCGAWDRFSRSELTIHIEYKVGADEINKITLMKNDIVP